MTLLATAPLPERAHAPSLFLRRLWAVSLRHLFLYRSSWPRLIETLFWPMINMLMLGFASLYLLQRFSSATIIANVFLAGVLLSETMLRTSMGMVVMFLEEIWSRNLGHMFASPLRIQDYIASMLGFTFCKTILSILPATLVAFWLFHYSLLSLGWPLLAYGLLLILNGWWYGLLVLSLLLRFGLAAEWMAWMSLWLLIPIIAPYYPVDILPGWMQLIAWSQPATYVFDSMKSLVGQGQLRGGNLVIALMLNLLYFIGAAAVFYRSYQGARRRGGLLQVGE